MALVTFGVKVPEELKEELTELMNNSGLARADFMALLRDLYKQSLISQEKEEALVETAAASSVDADPTEVAALIHQVKGLVGDFTDKKQLTEEIQRLRHEVDMLECLKDVQHQQIEELDSILKARNQRLRDRIDQLELVKQRLTDTEWEEVVVQYRQLSRKAYVEEEKVENK